MHSIIVSFAFLCSLTSSPILRNS